jgi:hypothetical protein
MKNGIHFGVPRSAYDELIDRVNYSTLKLFDRSAFHYKHAIDERLAPCIPCKGTGCVDEDHGMGALERLGCQECEGRGKVRKKDDDPEGADTLVAGQLAHTLALEPDLFESTYAVWNKADGKRDKRTDGYKRFLANAALERKVIVTDEQLEHARAIAKAVRTSPAAAPYIIGGQREVTVLWDYDEPQVGALDGWTMPMRARLDYVTDAAMLDLKTAASAKADEFARVAWNLGYFSQAAMQLDGFSAISRRVRPYLWLVVENRPPYAVAVYEPSKEGLELGRKRYQQWLRNLHICLERERNKEPDAWPGYTASPMQLDPPHWAMPREEVDEL